jgi:hypothetical protein
VGGAIINPSPAGGPVRSVQRRAPAFTYVVLARLRSCATRPSCLQRPAGGWAAIETREPSTLNWGRGYRNDVRLSVTHSAGRPDFGTTGVTGHRRTASDAGSNARVACTLPLASFGGGGPSIPGRTAGWPAPTTRPSPAGSRAVAFSSAFIRASRWACAVPPASVAVCCETSGGVLPHLTRAA